jgi:hypothetical protein
MAIPAVRAKPVVGGQGKMKAYFSEALCIDQGSSAV